MGWLQVEQRAVVIKSQKKLQNYIVDIMILKYIFCTYCSKNYSYSQPGYSLFGCIIALDHSR